MKKKLPQEAFGYYVSLGAPRTLQAVADRFSVSRRTVERQAEREEWDARIQAIELEARRAIDAELVKERVDMHLRHRKMLTAMAARAAKGMQEYPIANGRDAIKAAEIVIKLERLLAGEATDRTAVDVESIIKREMRELLVFDGDGRADEHGGVGGVGVGPEDGDG